MNKFLISVRDETVDSKSSSSCEDIHSFQSRGRPDGGEEEEEEEVGSSPPHPPAAFPAPRSKVKDLLLNWDKPPIAAKPEKRRESASSLSEKRRESASSLGESRREPSQSEIRREFSSTERRDSNLSTGEPRRETELLSRQDSTR